MPPYTSDDTLSQDPVFKGRIRMATVKAAVSISNEVVNPRSNLDRKRRA